MADIIPFEARREPGPRTLQSFERGQILDGPGRVSHVRIVEQLQASILARTIAAHGLSGVDWVDDGADGICLSALIAGMLRVCWTGQEEFARLVGAANLIPADKRNEAAAENLLRAAARQSSQRQQRQCPRTVYVVLRPHMDEGGRLMPGIQLLPINPSIIWQRHDALVPLSRELNPRTTHSLLAGMDALSELMHGPSFPRTVEVKDLRSGWQSNQLADMVPWLLAHARSAEGGYAAQLSESIQSSLQEAAFG